MYRYTKIHLISRTSDFETKFSPKKYDWQTFWKNKHWNCNKHIVMYTLHQISVNLKYFRFGDQIYQKKYQWQKFLKTKH